MNKIIDGLYVNEIHKIFIHINTRANI